MKTEMINHSFLSLSQDPSIHFLMTRFRHIPKSNYYWRSSVDNSSPSHQTLCWGTGERWVFLSPVEYSTSLTPPDPHCLTVRTPPQTFGAEHILAQAHECFVWFPLYRSPSLTFNTRVSAIVLPVLSSQIIDPFVEVEIIGLPVDCCKEQTRVVDDNGRSVC